MSILNKIKTGAVPRAQKVVIYAPEGFGKSTLASQFPAPLFLDVEDSTSQMDVARLGRDDLPGLRQVEQAIAEVAKARPCETLVIDTVDWLEQLAVEAMIKDASSDKITGIEDFGYGKGYTILKERISSVLSSLDNLIHSGINVVLLAHAAVKKHEPPDGAGPFDRYELKLSRQVAPMIKEWADMVLFGNWRTQVVERGRNEPGAKFKATGGRQRLLHCNRASAWDAKNRHGLKDEEAWSIDTVKKAFANVGAAWGKLIAHGVESIMPAVQNPVQVERVNEVHRTADPIPDIEQGEKADPELEAILQSHEEPVNQYLLAKNKISPGQSFRSVERAYRERILKNPAGFLSVVKGGAAA